MRYPWWLLGCLCCLLPLCPLFADGPTKVPSPPPTLAEALRALPPDAVGNEDVVLTVSPERVRLALPKRSAADTPAISPPDLPSADPEGVAARYRRITNWFGAVCAVAPPTMTVLNTDPALAQLPLGKLAGQHPETYLLGLLTPDQLRQVGADGLAYADMTPDQQSLMRDLLPEPLEIIPVSADPGNFHMEKAERRAARSAFDKQMRKVSGHDLYDALRLHAYLTADFYVHPSAGFGIGDTRDDLPSTGAYKLPFSGYGNMESRSTDTEGVLSANVPNVPKPGDLEWDRQDLTRLVSLADLKTVDDLIARLTGATGLELYADTHYATLPLLVTGHAARPQRAGDIMQALALCVCGTWRKVGPAFVLTDDVAGLGTRQAMLAEVGQVWSNRLSQAGRDASAHLQGLDWLHALPFVPGDLGALTAAQVDALHKQAGTNKGTLLWSDLTPALRDHLRDHFAHYGDDLPQSDPAFKSLQDGMKAAAASVQPNSPVDTTLNIRLAVELPGTGAMMLYGDYKVQTPDAPEKTPAKDGAAKAPSPPERSALPGSLHAILCAPTSPEAARAAVAALPGMGLNTVLLDVFTGGRASFANGVLPPTSADAAGILRAALDAARPRHIAVYAVLDTLCWRKDGLAAHPKPWPAGYQPDLTVRGETPDRAIQRRADAGSLSADYDHPARALASAGTQAWASPLDPAVRALLPALARTLAATPGLAGVVFQDTVPPGYQSGRSEGDGIGLGYTLPNRLAYLHRTHRDPVDLAEGGGMVMVFVSGETFFGHYWTDIPTFAVSTADYAAWTKSRADADRSLLAACWQAAHAAAPGLPLLRRAGRIEESFVPWTRPDQIDSEGLPMPHQPIPLMPPGSLSIQKTRYGEAYRAWPLPASLFQPDTGGIVFDLVGGSASDSLPDALRRLSGDLKAALPEAPTPP